jgi:transaldolase/glucose-6-phosphate isomerase
MTRLADLLAQGQSPWLDYVRRSLLTHGELKRMVEQQGITGVTINPTIFEKAIAGSHDYDEALKALLAQEPRLSAVELYEKLAVDDVRRAADVLRPVYDRTDGQDGYVSLEVAPGLAHDTAGTVREARRLWGEVGRPNLLIKVPATTEGVVALEQLLAEGVNVNATLIFSLRHYEAVAQAYLRGVAKAPDPRRVASVASVFVSRVDSAVDRALLRSKGPGASTLKGRVAVANCRVIYGRFREIFHGAEFAATSARGARPQRLLWASTSTKDPTYPDTFYVEELVGPETVDTLPPVTLVAFEDHGVVRGDRLTPGLSAARELLTQAAAVGIDLPKVTDDLQTEGVAAFATSYAALLSSIESKKASVLSAAVDPQVSNVHGDQPRLEARLEEWRAKKVAERLWRSDPTLWPAAPPSDVASRMGWLQLPEVMPEQLAAFVALANEVRSEDVQHVVLLGMGGSSLAPDVFRGVFGSRPAFPELFVLDSTHPDAVAALTRHLDLSRTLFIVSSKSGTTAEPLAFHRYFRALASASVGLTGRPFIAITDPGTPLEKLALAERFRGVYRALPSVGGRYSALTTFGLVPAALIGVDVRRMLDGAWTMAEACASSVPVKENPGLTLGALLGELATHGRDKLTLYASPGLAPFLDWVEQLVAESTGKAGKGIVPVVGEPLVEPEMYGNDRLFVELQESSSLDAALGKHTARLEAAGHPVIRIRVRDKRDLGEEFFRWEVAVASAGMVLGIDPFDQPDVELAKELARQAMTQPAGGPGSAAAETLRNARGEEFSRALAAWLAGHHAGEYLGIQAYLAPTPDTTTELQNLRRRLLERFHLATTLGYGPRFLHSTGQLHKGGPATGRFLQLVDTPQTDLDVPGAGYTFGKLIRAQALGDYQALRQKGRPVLRIDLGSDATGALRRMTEAFRG